MKNSERIKQILIDMALDNTLPSDMNELDSNLFAFVDEDIFNGWTEEDIVHQGQHMFEDGEIDSVLTEDEIEDVKSLCVKYFDAGNGFCWDDISTWILEVRKEK
jgi:hypothetical protein